MVGWVEFILFDIYKEAFSKQSQFTPCVFSHSTVVDLFSGVPKVILTRVKWGKKTKVWEELHSFAVTLHFYSTKAKAYVRECFDLVLPHPETIRLWYSKISADRGFTKPAFSAIKSCVRTGNKREKKPGMSSLMDEVAICKYVEYAAGKFHGYVDLGCGIVDDSLPPAIDALIPHGCCHWWFQKNWLERSMQMSSRSAFFDSMTLKHL